MMGDAETKAEHSPFIRQVLGDMADSVTPAPPPAPYEDVALLWCVQGVEQIDEDPWSAALSLAVAVAYGSNEAMAWLGGALIDHAYVNGDLTKPEWRAIAMEGLSWLEVADACGIAYADRMFGIAQQGLPADLITEWAAMPARFAITYH